MHLSLNHSEITLPPLIDIAEIKEEYLAELCGSGLGLLRKGKVALVLMLFGKSENTKDQSKALARLPLPGEPTVLECIMRRYVSYLKGEGSSIVSPVVVICSVFNFESVISIFEKNSYFGLKSEQIKIVTESRSVPLIDDQGKLYLSAARQTLSNPAGTAMAVSRVLESEVK